MNAIIFPGRDHTINYPCNLKNHIWNQICASDKERIQKYGTLLSLLITYYISNFSLALKMSHLTFYTWHSIPKPEMEIVLLKHFSDFFFYLKKKIIFHFHPSTRFYQLPGFLLMLVCTGQENLREDSELFTSRYFIVLRQRTFTGWQIYEQTHGIWKSQLPSDITAAKACWRHTENQPSEYSSPWS